GAQAQVEIVDATSKGGLASAKAALSGSNAGVQSAGAQIAAAHAQAARADADLANARIRSAEAALALAKLQLGYTKVTAPADGFASKLTVHAGQLVTVGQPLIQLVPTTTYVIANFKETQIGEMKVGQSAKIEIDALPGRTFDGKVESLAGGTGASFSLLPADNATGNFVKVVQRVPVRIAWTNPPTDVDLRAGLSADVTVDVRK
ncbi:MAG: efflux RND transporter periplasmic adaptor subunit, partial [Polyangia bacterium]